MNIKTDGPNDPLSTDPSELAKQLRLAAAFNEAVELAEKLGDEHPETMQAVLCALELADPGCTRRKLAECGISLPEPTHVADSGERFYATTAVAKALNVPHEDVLQRVEEMKASGLDVAFADQVHRIQ